MKVITDMQNSLKLELSGSELREMFAAATSWLEKSSAAIDALNVFPVPDGDTGTNMMLTMRSTMEEAFRAPGHSASGVAQAMAKGALMGARGNSGVILSQIWRGLAQGLEGKESFTAADLADALQQSAIVAYKALSNPVEGTMLTVMNEAAAAARSQVADGKDDILMVLEATVNAAGDSVADTPRLLKVLREAGVVDAGGQGLYTILEGALRYLKGETVKSDDPVIKQPAPITTGPVSGDEKAYGYCTEMIIKGDQLKQDQIRRWVESQGESVLVVGDEETVKIHVHTLHPGTILEFAVSLGTVHNFKIQNMDEQHEDFLQKSAMLKKSAEIAIVAVVTGEGLKEVFRSLGATAIVPGGQTMNPSCSDILQTINSVSSDQVIVLPNNKNVIPAANQAAELAKKTVRVLPTRSIPQGLSAMVCFNREAGLDKNLVEMSRCQEQVKSIEITTAVRDAQVNELQIKKGNYIGLINGDIKVACESSDQVVFRSLELVDAGNAGIVTLFYGNHVGDGEATELRNSLKEKYPGLDIELIRGSQPHYSYIISVE